MDEVNKLGLVMLTVILIYGKLAVYQIIWILCDMGEIRISIIIKQVDMINLT